MYFLAVIVSADFAVPNREEETISISSSNGCPLMGKRELSHSQISVSVAMVIISFHPPFFYSIRKVINTKWIVTAART